MVQDHIKGVAQAPCQVDQGAVSKLVDLEDTVVDVSDAIDVVLEHVDAEGVTQAWESGRVGLSEDRDLGLGPTLLHACQCRSHYPKTSGVMGDFGSLSHPCSTHTT